MSEDSLYGLCWTDEEYQDSDFETREECVYDYEYVFSGFEKQAQPHEPDSISIIERRGVVRVVWTSAVPLAMVYGWKTVASRYYNPSSFSGISWPSQIVVLAQRYADLMGYIYVGNPPFLWCAKKD